MSAPPSSNLCLSLQCSSHDSVGRPAPSSVTGGHALPPPCLLPPLPLPKKNPAPPPLCFIVELRLSHHLRCGPTWQSLHDLVGRCSPRPANSTFWAAEDVVAALYFEKWDDARDAALHLWESRISGAHPSSSSITLLAGKIRALMDREVASKWEVKLGEVIADIAQAKALMSRQMSLGIFFSSTSTHALDMYRTLQKK